MTKSVKALLDQAAHRLTTAGIDSAAHDARILLMHVTGLSRADLITSPDHTLSPRHEKAYMAMAERRAGQEPLAYITGTQPFWTLDLHVSPDTLIPRPETEEVVRRALDVIKDIKSPHILDIGTGSGAILLSLLSQRKDASGLGIDISEAALKIARENARINGLSGPALFKKSDMFESVKGRFDLIVSNPPYIASDIIESLDEDVRKFEPRSALDGGANGLDFYKIITLNAKKFLTPSGALIMEIGYDQGKTVPALCLENGYHNVYVYKDLANLNRIVTAFM